MVQFDLMVYDGRFSRLMVDDFQHAALTLIPNKQLRSKRTNKSINKQTVRRKLC